MGIETFVFDYHGDAYGKKIEVALYEYVRPEKKFHSVETVSYTHLDVYKRQKWRSVLTVRLTDRKNLSEF